MTITEVRNAQSLNVEATAFDLEINHPTHGWIPYTLSSEDTDVTVDNMELLELIGDDYQPYMPPSPEEITDELSASVRSQRDNLLRTEVDVIAGNPLRWAELTEEQRDAWAGYRLDLLDLPQQEGFPHDVIWPVKPL